MHPKHCYNYFMQVRIYLQQSLVEYVSDQLNDDSLFYGPSSEILTLLHSKNIRELNDTSLINHYINQYQYLIKRINKEKEMMLTQKNQCGIESNVKEIVTKQLTTTWDSILNRLLYHKYTFTDHLKKFLNALLDGDLDIVLYYSGLGFVTCLLGLGGLKIIKYISSKFFDLFRNKYLYVNSEFLREIFEDDLGIKGHGNKVMLLTSKSLGDFNEKAPPLSKFVHHVFLKEPALNANVELTIDGRRYPIGTFKNVDTVDKIDGQNMEDKIKGLLGITKIRSYYVSNFRIKNNIFNNLYFKIITGMGIGFLMSFLFSYFDYKTIIQNGFHYQCIFCDALIFSTHSNLCDKCSSSKLKPIDTECKNMEHIELKFSKIQKIIKKFYKKEFEKVLQCIQCKGKFKDNHFAYYCPLCIKEGYNNIQCENCVSGILSYNKSTFISESKYYPSLEHEEFIENEDVFSEDESINESLSDIFSDDNNDMKYVPRIEKSINDIDKCNKLTQTIFNLNNNNLKNKNNKSELRKSQVLDSSDIKEILTIKSQTLYDWLHNFVLKHYSFISEIIIPGCIGGLIGYGSIKLLNKLLSNKSSKYKSNLLCNEFQPLDKIFQIESFQNSIVFFLYESQEFHGDEDLIPSILNVTQINNSSKLKLTIAKFDATLTSKHHYNVKINNEIKAFPNFQSIVDMKALFIQPKGKSSGYIEFNKEMLSLIPLILGKQKVSGWRFRKQKVEVPFWSKYISPNSLQTIGLLSVGIIGLSMFSIIRRIITNLKYLKADMIIVTSSKYKKKQYERIAQHLGIKIGFISPTWKELYTGNPVFKMLLNVEAFQSKCYAEDVKLIINGIEYRQICDTRLKTLNTMNGQNATMKIEATFGIHAMTESIEGTWIGTNDEKLKGNFDTTFKYKGPTKSPTGVQSSKKIELLLADINSNDSSLVAYHPRAALIRQAIDLGNIPRKNLRTYSKVSSFITHYDQALQYLKSLFSGLYNSISSFQFYHPPLLQLFGLWFPGQYWPKTNLLPLYIGLSNCKTLTENKQLNQVSLAKFSYIWSFLFLSSSYSKKMNKRMNHENIEERALGARLLPAFQYCLNKMPSPKDLNNIIGLDIIGALANLIISQFDDGSIAPFALIGEVIFTALNATNPIEIVMASFVGLLKYLEKEGYISKEIYCATQNVSPLISGSFVVESFEGISEPTKDSYETISEKWLRQRKLSKIIKVKWLHYDELRSLKGDLILKMDNESENVNFLSYVSNLLRVIVVENDTLAYSDGTSEVPAKQYSKLYAFISDFRINKEPQSMAGKVTASNYMELMDQNQHSVGLGPASRVIPPDYNLNSPFDRYTNTNLSKIVNNGLFGYLPKSQFRKVSIDARSNLEVLGYWPRKIRPISNKVSEAWILKHLLYKNKFHKYQLPNFGMYSASQGIIDRYDYPDLKNNADSIFKLTYQKFLHFYKPMLESNSIRISAMSKEEVGIQLKRPAKCGVFSEFDTIGDYLDDPNGYDKMNSKLEHTVVHGGEMNLTFQACLKVENLKAKIKSKDIKHFGTIHQPFIKPPRIFATLPGPVRVMIARRVTRLIKAIELTPTHTTSIYTTSLRLSKLMDEYPQITWIFDQMEVKKMDGHQDSKNQGSFSYLCELVSKNFSDDEQKEFMNYYYQNVEPHNNAFVAVSTSTNTAYRFHCLASGRASTKAMNSNTTENVQIMALYYTLDNNPSCVRKTFEELRIPTELSIYGMTLNWPILISQFSENGILYDSVGFEKTIKLFIILCHYTVLQTSGDDGLVVLPSTMAYEYHQNLLRANAFFTMQNDPDNEFTDNILNITYLSHYFTPVWFGNVRYYMPYRKNEDLLGKMLVLTADYGEKTKRCAAVQLARVMSAVSAAPWNEDLSKVLDILTEIMPEDILKEIKDTNLPFMEKTKYAYGFTLEVPTHPSLFDKWKFFKTLLPPNTDYTNIRYDKSSFELNINDCLSLASSDIAYYNVSGKEGPNVYCDYSSITDPTVYGTYFDFIQLCKCGKYKIIFYGRLNDNIQNSYAMDGRLTTQFIKDHQITCQLFSHFDYPNL